MDPKEQELIEARDEASREWDEAYREEDEADHEWDEAHYKWDKAGRPAADEAYCAMEKANRKGADAARKRAGARCIWVATRRKLQEYHKIEA